MTPEDDHSIVCHLDELFAARNKALTQLTEIVEATIERSLLKNNRARAIRFTTLTAICRRLEREVGKLFSTREVGSKD